MPKPLDLKWVEPSSMDQPELLYNDFYIEKVLGEVPRLTIKVTVKDNNPSAGLQCWLHINRIAFSVSLHSAKDPSSSFETARLGTFDSLEPVTLLQGSSAYVLFSLPLSSAIIERMLEIRDNGEHVAFKITIIIAAIYYRKQQDGVVILDVIQVQSGVLQNTEQGKTSLIVISGDRLSQLLHHVRYTEILKFEIPLYMDASSITNEPLRKTLTLFKHAAALLRQGNNEGALVDIRKSLTNYLLADRGLNNERTLDKSIHRDWINKSPAEVTAIYEDILLRIQEVLRAALKITDKFLHDDNTLAMPLLRKDVEYVYFTTTHAVSQLIGNPRI